MIKSTTIFMRCILFVCTILLVNPMPSYATDYHSVSYDDVYGLYRVDVAVDDEYALKQLSNMHVSIVTARIGTSRLLVDISQIQLLVYNGYRVQQMISLNALDVPEIHDVRSRINADTYEQRHIIANPSLLQSQAAPILTKYQARINSLPVIDSDGDGISDDEEIFWCTDRLRSDSDGDGITDGEEISSLHSWFMDYTRPFSINGMPFIGSRLGMYDCLDIDQDSVPDLVEVLLGLNPKNESTDNDMYDDGQELFGLTLCHTQNQQCTYGKLPEVTAGDNFISIPQWLQVPARHPLVAAMPNIVMDIQSVEIVQAGQRQPSTFTAFAHRGVDIDSNRMQRLFNANKKLQDINPWSIADSNNPFIKQYGTKLFVDVLQNKKPERTTVVITYQYRNIGGDIFDSVSQNMLNATFGNDNLVMEQTNTISQNLLPNQVSELLTATVVLEKTSFIASTTSACNEMLESCKQAINFWMQDTFSGVNEQVRQKNISFDMVYTEKDRNRPIGQFLIPMWNASFKEESIPDILSRVFTITRNKYGDPIDIIIPTQNTDGKTPCENGERRGDWWYCRYTLIGAQQITHSPMLNELYEFQSYTAVPSAYVYFNFPNDELQNTINLQMNKNNLDAVVMRAADVNNNMTNQSFVETDKPTPTQTMTATPPIVNVPTQTVSPILHKGQVASSTPDLTQYCRIFSGENVPLAINDNTESTSYAYINEKFNITQIKIVNLNITHTFVGDMTIKLISPQGESVVLFNKHGGSGDNFVNTTFDDNVAMYIADGVAPYSAAYQPYEYLGVLNGAPAQGVWQLSVKDSGNGDIGMLTSWQISICGDIVIPATTVPTMICKSFRSTDIPKNIAYRSPNTPVQSGIYVGDDFALRTIRITNLSIDHTYISDVIGKLIDPRGGTVVLFNRVGGSGKKFSAVGFRDDAAQSINAGSSPFSGNYRPAEPLSSLAWGRSSGSWFLDLQDVHSSDNGKLLSWTLELCGFYTNVTPSATRTSTITRSNTATRTETYTPSNTATRTATRTNTGTRTVTPDSVGRTATSDALITTRTNAPFATMTALVNASATKGIQQSATAEVQATSNAIATFWRNVERTQGAAITATIRRQSTTTAQALQTRYALASRTANALRATNNALQATAYTYRTQTVAMQKTNIAIEVMRTQSALNNNGSTQTCIVSGGCRFTAWGNDWESENLSQVTNNRSVSTTWYIVTTVNNQGVPSYRTRCPLVGPGSGYCAMLNNRVYENPPPSWYLSKVRYMEFGHDAFQFQREDGSVGIWPLNYATPWILAGVGQVNSVEVTDDNYGVGNVFFALRQNGTVLAWGENVYTTPTVLYADEPIVNVDAACATVGFLTSSGKLYTSNIRYASEAVCKYTGNPPAYNDYVAFSIGHTHGIAVRSNGDIVTFGYGIAWAASYGYTNAMLYPPYGIGPVKAVAAGAHHGCAVRVNGSVVCWGKNTHNQMQVPTGNINGIISGAIHSVAISGSRSIVIPPPPPIVGELRTFQVTNANQQPIPNLPVVVFNNQNAIPTSSITDENGYISVNYIPGNIRVHVVSDVWQIPDTQTINFDTNVVPQVVANRIPVIVVPGIMGSFLDYSGCNIWLGFSRFLRCELLPDKRPLLSNNTNIIATDAIRDIEITVPFLNYNLLDKSLAYDTLIDQLTSNTDAPLVPFHEMKQNLGIFDDAKTPVERCQDANRYVFSGNPALLRKNTTLYVFGYDWRRSTKQSAVSLKQLIDCVRNTHGGGRVNLVGHSMGGLVIKQYILSQQRNPNYVNRISTFNTPYLGAMRALEIFIDGNYDLSILALMLNTVDLEPIEDLNGSYPTLSIVELMRAVGLHIPALYWELKDRVRKLARASMGAIELMPTDIYLKAFSSDVIQVNSMWSSESFSYNYDGRSAFWQNLDKYVSGSLKVSSNRLKDQTAVDVGTDNSAKIEQYTKNIDYLIQFSSNPNTTIARAERNWLTMWSFAKGAGDGTVPEFSLSRKRGNTDYNPQSTADGSRFVAINAYCGLVVDGDPLDHTSLTKYPPAINELKKFLSQEQYTGTGNTNCVNGANATAQNVAAPMQIARQYQVVFDNLLIVEQMSELKNTDIKLPIPSRYVFDATQPIPMQFRVKTNAIRSGIWSLVIEGNKVFRRDVWVDTLPIGSELIVEVVDSKLVVKPVNKQASYQVLSNESANGVDFVPPVPAYTLSQNRDHWAITSRVSSPDTLWYSYDGLNYQQITTEVVLDKSTPHVWVYAEDQYHNRSELLFVRP